MLEIVAEKTGYPKDMLDLDLDLEADLGVDTVKQAEMFAAVRAAYSIPRDENLKLRDFPTLAHVIQFAHDGQRAARGTPQARESAARRGMRPLRGRCSPASKRRTHSRAACPCRTCARRSPSASRRACTLEPGPPRDHHAGQRRSGAKRWPQRLRAMGVEVLSIEDAPMPTR